MMETEWKRRWRFSFLFAFSYSARLDAIYFFLFLSLHGPRSFEKKKDGRQPHAERHSRWIMIGCRIFFVPTWSNVVRGLRHALIYRNIMHALCAKCIVFGAHVHQMQLNALWVEAFASTGPPTPSFRWRTLVWALTSVPQSKRPLQKLLHRIFKAKWNFTRLEMK
jgi:hypothetical protein